MKRHRSIISFLFFMIVVSCGVEDTLGDPNIDPQLTGYVDEFFSILRKNRVGVSAHKFKEIDNIQFANTSSDHLYGKCTIDENKDKIASVNVKTSYVRNVDIYLHNIQKDFPDQSETVLKMVVFHELIHCVFEKEHDETNRGIMAKDITHVLTRDAIEMSLLIDFSLTDAYISELNRIEL
ncbi:MAG: hypothetical protein HRU09_15465 [Oligoflexales bacterium]|nr:hypothetical protein [Oligoflexales bacterium]